MKALLISTALLVASAAVSAQQVNPATPTTNPAAGTATQDPELVHEPTPAERIAQLKAQIEKLQVELKTLDKIEKAGGISAQVKATVSARRVVAKSFADPNPQPQPVVQPVQAAPQPTKKSARLLGDAEKEGLAPDVIFVVDGEPVTKGEFDRAMAYLQSYPQDQTPEQLKTRAVMELVNVKAVKAAFPESSEEAKTRILDIQKKLKSGEVEFAELASESSDCPSKARGGDLDFFGRGQMDFWFTAGAFDLEVGEVSDVIETGFGYHLIKVTAKEAGDTKAQDRVRASHILAQYTPNQLARSQAVSRANSGQADLAFVSDDYRAYTPPAYK